MIRWPFVTRRRYEKEIGAALSALGYAADDLDLRSHEFLTTTSPYEPTNLRVKHLMSVFAARLEIALDPKVDAVSQVSLAIYDSIVVRKTLTDENTRLHAALAVAEAKLDKFDVVSGTLARALKNRTKKK